MRINKYIASSGMCSRRKAEEYITKGLVSVNGLVATLSTAVQENDVVLLNGNPIKINDDFIVLMFNKPRGITCTTELKIKDNIIDYINYPQRIFPIGRLDKDSRGLILLTNNGDLVNECLRVENNHEKEYFVRVNKPINSNFLEKMSEGVEIYNPVSDSMVTTLPCKIIQKGKDSFNITLKQGLNRQIRRMCSKLGFHVTYLKRTRFMHLKLDIEEGQYRLLSTEEINKLTNSTK